MRKLFTLCLALAAAAFFGRVTFADDWSQFRGPFFNGSSDAKNLPVKFSPTENVLWSADLPGSSAATPVVWGDRVFVSSTDAERNTLVAICIDKKTGETIWKKDVVEGKVRQDTRSNYSAPSPATDGKTVVFFYGTGDVVAFDLAGKEQWSKDIGPFAFLWTFSTSPVIYEGKLILQVLQRDVPVGGRAPQASGPIESYLLALDPATGKELYRHARPAKAVAESLESFNTPMPYVHNGQKMLIVAGGDALTGHDPADGTELWRWETWNPGKIPHWRLVPSPVAGDGIALVCAPKRDPVYAIKLGGKGKLGPDAVAWTSKEAREVSSDVPSPAFYDGDFFVLSDVRNVLARVEPKTGKVKWVVETPGRVKYEASPTLADGKAYIVNFDGVVSVLSAEDGKLLHSVQMEVNKEDVVRSSVVPAGDGQILVRTVRKLFCVGK